MYVRTIVVGMLETINVRATTSFVDAGTLIVNYKEYLLVLLRTSLPIIAHTHAPRSSTWHCHASTIIMLTEQSMCTILPTANKSVQKE